MRTFIPIATSEDPRVSIIQRGQARGQRREWAERSNSRVDNFKNSVRLELFSAQLGVCGYCLLPIGNVEARRVPQIDHLVPWKRYPEWTFEPLNFVLACATCNENRKGDTDTLHPSSRRRPLCQYSKLDFLIVHPYIDDVGKHIDGGFSDPSLPPSPIVGISEKGISTIELFGLDSADMLRLWEDEYFRFRRSKWSAIDRERFNAIMNEISS